MRLTNILTAQEIWHVFIKCFFFKGHHDKYKATIYMFCSSDRNFNTISRPRTRTSNSQFKELTIYKKECGFSIITWMICILLRDFGLGSWRCFVSSEERALLHWYCITCVCGGGVSGQLAGAGSFLLPRGTPGSDSHNQAWQHMSYQPSHLTALLSLCSVVCSFHIKCPHKSSCVEVLSPDW